MKKRVKLNFRTYVVVSRAVEEGVTLGYNRAHKHTDEPEEDVIKEHMEREVMAALDEVIDFD